MQPIQNFHLFPIRIRDTRASVDVIPVHLPVKIQVLVLAQIFVQSDLWYLFNQSLAHNLREVLGVLGLDLAHVRVIFDID